MLVFAYPWLWWLAPAPLLVYWGLPAWKHTPPSVRVPFLDRLIQAQGGELAARSKRWWKAGIMGLMWLSCLCAAARPQWLQPPVERTVPTRDLLLLVDLSSSMDHQDFTNDAGEAVDRLTAVKQVLGDFLLRREGDRVGLVVFGNAPFLQVPFTPDLQLCHDLLEETQVGMAGPRTALGDAIGLGLQLFDDSDAPTKTMIALTDGNDTASAVPPIEAARVARDREITIYTIAIGDPSTVGEEKLDREALTQVAKTTGGETFLALDRQQLEGVYAKLDQIETRDIQTVSHQPRHDVFYWPLALALLCWWLPVLRLWLSHRAVRTTPSSARLRVNNRTFEMEAVD